VKDAIDNLKGESYATFRSALLGDRYLRTAMNRRMQEYQAAATADGRQEGVWLNMWDFDGRVNGDLEVAPVQHMGSGVTAGLDHRFQNGDGQDLLVAGLNVAMEDARIQTHHNRNARMEVDSYSLGGYIATSFGTKMPLHLHAGFAHSHLLLSSQRDITVPGLESTAQAKYQGSRQQVFVEFSTEIAIGTQTMLAPYVQVTASRLRTDEVRETGSLAALEMDVHKDSSREAIVGLRMNWRLPTYKPASIVGEIARMWTSGGALQSTVDTRFADGTGSAFTVRSADVGRDATTAGLWLQYHFTTRVAVQFGYYGQFGDGWKYHSAQLLSRRVF